MNLSLGIVGLPNVGKSTLFNTLTNIAVPAENYPFCTIDPNFGIVQVPDERIEKISKIVCPKKITHAVVEFVDIAGLVRGAHEGQGLGNKFLSHIRNVDAIVHIIRAFESSDILHVENRIDPKADKEIVEAELIFKDLDSLEKKKAGLLEEVKHEKTLIPKLNLVSELIKTLESDRLAVSLQTDPKEADLMKFRKELFLLTDKPVIYVLNVNSVQYDKARLIDKYRSELCIDPQYNIIPMNIKQEFEISRLENKEKEEFLDELGIKSSALDDLITDSYKLLNLISFFTAGEDEARAWTIVKGSKAPEAAGTIHTDFEQKFIAAEVIDYKDFISNNGWLGAKNAGKIRTEGRNYNVKDGDVIVFRHGA